MYPCKNIGCRQMFDYTINRRRHYNKCEKNKPKQSNGSRHVREPCKPKKAPVKSYSFYCRVCKKSFPNKCKLTKHVSNPQVIVLSMVEEAIHNYPDDVMFHISFAGIHCIDKFAIGLFTICQYYVSFLRHNSAKLVTFRLDVFPLLFHYKMYPKIGLKHL